MNARRWTAEVYRADRRQVGLCSPGDGRPDSHPFADPGTIHVIGADEARALGEALIAAADAIAPRARRFFVFDGESYDATHTSPDDAHFKQHGEWVALPSGYAGPEEGRWVYNTQRDAVFMHRLGKKATGRVLDGRTWDELPSVAP